MAGVRIRWRGVARVATILLVGLFAVRLLPGFLRAPEPPPPAADVGLPKAMPVTEVPGRLAADRPATRLRKQRRRSRPSRKSRARPARNAPASKAVIGSKRRQRARKVAERPSRSEPAPERSPPPVPEYVQPPAPEPVPEPSPVPRSAPGDGSEEFAPH